MVLGFTTALMLTVLSVSTVASTSVSAALPVGEGGGSAAVDCPDEGDCAKTTSFAFNCGGSTPQKTNVGISCLIITVLNFMSIAVGILVVGGVTAGGIMYSASGGNPGKKQQGVTIIVNAVIGLVLYLLLWAIIQFLIPGGVLK